ncbi:MAG: hypothetical protein ACLFVB_09245 [Thermoplasmata archaeon]
MKDNSPEKPQDEVPDPDELFINGTAEKILDALLYQTKVYVIGVGGCGCNTVESITDSNMSNVKTIGINTDKKVLGDLDVDRQMLIGKEITNGEGAKGDPRLGKRAAKLNEEQILKTIDDADFVVVVAGLGGGTGSGASQVVADLARRNGKMVVTYAIMPFSVEKNRYERAQKVVKKMSNISHATTIFENDKALNYGDKTPQEAFSMANRMLENVVKHIKMDNITQFFDEVGLDALGLSKTLSNIEKEEEQGVEKPPVLEALKYVEKEESGNEENMNSFLEHYA